MSRKGLELESCVAENMNEKEGAWIRMRERTDGQGDVIPPLVWHDDHWLRAGFPISVCRL